MTEAQTDAPMGFADLIEQAGAESRRGGTCSVAMWRDQQSEATQAQFNAAIASDTTSTVIHKAMKAMGYQREVTALHRHRRGECHCDVQR